MNLTTVLKLLSDRAGLDPGSLGSAAVNGAVAARLRACGLDVAAYAGRLADDPAEVAALLDEVVVPETWFFRGGDLFSHLAERARGVRAFRALSLPCSTGEEPYSLAIALAEAGVLSSCVIDAVDVSPRNVAQAQAGVFAELSFRQTDPVVRARHFRPVAEGWRIDEPLRQAVRFLVGNVLDPALLIFERPYDVVFCRNLFIYLTPAARRQALAALARLVTPGGLLAVGHAEPIDPDDARFRRDGPEGMFLYRRSAMSAAHPGLPAPRGGKFPTCREPLPVPDAPPIGRLEIGRHEKPDVPARDALLTQARQQADVGQLSSALSLCQSIQDRFGHDADTYSLAGIIHQARQDRASATQAFRKALYLEPNHREALTHLMLLCQQHGDQTQAEVLRKRLLRLPATGEQP